MLSREGLTTQITQYLILADQLKSQFSDIDEETLRDTLEGISNLPDLIQAVVRSSLEDGMLISGLKERLEEMQERLTRFKNRQERKRALVCWAMRAADMDRLQTPDFSVFVRAGGQCLEITNESRIPGQFFIHLPARLDRAGLTAALKRGEPVDGALLAPGEPGITVRVR